MEMIANKYTINEFLGKGKFGSVYKGIKKNGEMVAIKMESRTTDIPLLKKEARILEYLARNGLRDIVPTVFWYGMYLDKMCVVMSFLGEQALDHFSFPSLDSLFEWFQTAVHMMESIHFYGVIHRDLKPGHFLFSDGKWRIIDFGFAVFVSEEKTPIPGPVPAREYVIGTPNYISRNVHQGIEPGKNDDMISLGYIFLEKYRGVLPWSGPGTVDETPYPVNHILHPLNQYRLSLKEPAIFLQEIADIPGLVSFMRKHEC